MIGFSLSPSFSFIFRCILALIFDSHSSFVSFFCILNLNILFLLSFLLNAHDIDRVRIDWIPRGIIQWCFAYKFGNRIVRFGSHREQQSESWSYICCSPLLCHFPRRLLVYSFRLRHMVSPFLSFYCVSLFLRMGVLIAQYLPLFTQ